MSFLHNMAEVFNKSSAGFYDGTGWLVDNVPLKAGSAFSGCLKGSILNCTTNLSVLKTLKIPGTASWLARTESIPSETLS